MRTSRYERRSWPCAAGVWAEALEARTMLAAIAPALSIGTIRPVGAGVAAGVSVPLRAGVGTWSRTPVLRPIAEVQRVSPFATSPPGSALTPAKVRHAYGADAVTFGAIEGNGVGQTIAIIGAYDYPTAEADLHAFSVQFGLPDPPSFRRVAQDGSATYPPVDPAGPGAGTATWSVEAALDLQWAHAMAPMANLILVEATDATYPNVVQAAVAWARSQPDVSVVSMSFGSGEFAGQSSFDTYFTTPAGHGGVTFLAATGDTGRPGTYPAYSPNVVAIGGTSLTVSGTTYVSESGWAGSGGGISQYQLQPAYQQGVVTQSTTMRTTPDVSIVADPNTGVAVYNSYDYPTSPWIQLGGTSLSTPLWAGLMAVANQGRALTGQASLDGATQTLPALYQLAASDFHDVVTGNNGFAAGVGYDLVTGRGTPLAEKLLPHLAGVGSVAGRVFDDRDADGVADAGEPGLGGVEVFVDANDNGVRDASGSGYGAYAGPAAGIPSNNTTGVTTSLTVEGTAGPIADVNVTLSINHFRPSDLTAYLIGPDGTQVQLFSAVDGNGAHFTGTTLDDEAATAITAGAAPFSGSFRPSPGALSAFDGKLANGTWKLKVVDGRASYIGSVTGWSVSLTTGPEPAATTDAAGAYLLGPYAAGTYVVRQVLPAGRIQTLPAGGSPPAGRSVLVSGNVGGLDFGSFPTTFTPAGAEDAYYVRLDAGGTKVQISAGATPLPTPTYEVPLAALPSLTFALAGAANRLTVDFTNGSPLPAGDLWVTGNAAGTSWLRVVAAGASQPFTMTNATIALDGRTLRYGNVYALQLDNARVSYTGRLDTLEQLFLRAGTVLSMTL